MKAGKVKPWRGLVSPKRSKELEAACKKIVETITAVSSKYGVEVICSRDSNFIEVLDPSSQLPNGYEYVALITLDEDEKSYEICELIDQIEEEGMASLAHRESSMKCRLERLET